MKPVGGSAAVQVSRTGSLPLPSTPLIGRDAELAALGAELSNSDERLITLTGPPGVGKTRLAIATATAAAARFADGVVFVDLAPIRDPDLVLAELARSLGLGDARGQSLADRLRTAIAGQDLLLVVDNVEHVLDAGPAIAAPLTTCPRLRILATSRERLHLAGEREFRVSPLALPAPEDVDDLERFGATASIAMLLHRVHRFQPDFALTHANAPSLAEICVRLDGLPLALELGAARLKLFTPGELTFRLRHRMGLLTSGARDAPDRHQTLRAALAWSHDLLNPDERAVFRRLAVFVGGWTLDAAQQVCDVPDIVETVASLVDKSMVLRRTGPSAVGEFVMLESLREYAGELLVAVGELDATRDRHMRYHADLAARTEAQIASRTETESVTGVGAAEGNLRQAYERASTTGNCELALPLAAALGWYCYTRGHLGQGLATLDHTLAVAQTQPDPPPDHALAAALSVAGVLCFAQGELDRAQELIDRSARIGRRIDDARRDAICSAFRGHLARARGDYPRAVACYDRARGLHEALGNTAGVAWSRYDLGLLARGRDELPAAGGHLRAALDAFRGERYAWAVGCAAWALATVEQRQGRVAEAAVLLAEALDGVTTVDDGRGLAQILEAAAAVACERGRHASAGQLLGAAAVLRERLAAPLPNEDRGRHHAVTQRVRRAVGPEDAERTRRSGRELPPGQVLALARSVVGTVAGIADGTTTVPGIDQPGCVDPTSPLTPRERQVARLIASGCTNRQIGRTLGIAEKTTEVHVHHIIGKLGARSRSEVAAWVGAQGLH